MKAEARKIGTLAAIASLLALVAGCGSAADGDAEGRVDWYLLRNTVPEALTVRAIVAGGGVVSRKNALADNLSVAAALDDEHVSFIVPTQANAIGPAFAAWQNNVYSAHSFITVAAVDSATRKRQNIVLRATRMIGCGFHVQMENPVQCYDIRESQLNVEFLLNDNPSLAAGCFVGTFRIDAVVWANQGAPRSMLFAYDIKKS